MNLTSRLCAPEIVVATICMTTMISSAAAQVNSNTLVTSQSPGTLVAVGADDRGACLIKKTEFKDSWECSDNITRAVCAATVAPVRDVVFFWNFYKDQTCSEVLKEGLKNSS